MTCTPPSETALLEYARETLKIPDVRSITKEDAWWVARIGPEKKYYLGTNVEDARYVLRRIAE